MSEADRPVIVFDSLCRLCSANAQFVLTHDKKAHFRLATLQSQAGVALYRRFGLDPEEPESFILVTGDHALRDSDAVLALYSGLGWPWRLAALGRAVPRALRDPLYRWVARNRYRLFGKRDTCWRPSADLEERFL
jgi:predicted DCC family thiol-disulfide oxidoreductase YuxK